MASHHVSDGIGGRTADQHRSDLAAKFGAGLAGFYPDASMTGFVQLPNYDVHLEGVGWPPNSEVAIWIFGEHDRGAGTRELGKPRTDDAGRFKFEAAYSSGPNHQYWWVPMFVAYCGRTTSAIYVAGQEPVRDGVSVSQHPTDLHRHGG